MKTIKKYIGTPKQLLHILVGNLGYALGMNLFLFGNNISSGGFSGLGFILSHFLPVTVGTVIFAVSIPVFIWSFRVQGAKYTLSALISTVVLSVSTDLLSFLPTITENRLLAAICGGAMYGFSATILIRGRVSGSGTDLLARLMVTKFRRLSLGAYTFMCDAVVITLSAVAFGDIETAIYAAISILVSSFVTDTAISGFNRACMFQIITSADPDELSKIIYGRLDRGVTLIPATGMYKREGKNMLIVVVGRRQIYEMKDIIKECAPDSFVILSNITEIMGEGFRGLDVAVPVKSLEDNGEK